MVRIPSMTDLLRRSRPGTLAGAEALVRRTLAAGPSLLTPSTAAKDMMALMRQAANVVEPGRDDVAHTTGSDARFASYRHTGPAGGIDYRLYRPANASADMPLVVMLHGCTQSPEDFARGTGMNQLAEERGFLVAYPRQPQSANMQKCWNWYQPANQARDRGEPALIAGVTREIIARERADPRRVYVAGLSAGGAAAAIMADAYPELFAAVGIHSGLACGAAHDMSTALAAMKQGVGDRAARRSDRSGSPPARFVPVITFHGDRDATVGEVNARDIVRAATAATGVPVTVTVETGEADGRRYQRAQSRDPQGTVLIEQWTVEGAGHAWSGGDATGSYADAAGPDASRAMLDFFLQHRGPVA
jgi:poly(hydroxyalkanoate) depolymerase family esterase